MKILYLLIAPLLLSACGLSTTQTNERIWLSAEFYQNPSHIEITSSDDYQSLVDEKKTYILYIYNPSCYACGLFYPHLQSFVTNEKIAIHQMTTSVLSNTNLGSVFNYTPSLGIFEEGQFYALLDPTNADDEAAFTSTSALTSWIYRYINHD